MGLFGKNNEEALKIAQSWAHDLRNVAQEDLDLVNEFERNSEKFEGLTESFNAFAKEILRDIPQEKSKELVDFVERFYDLEKEYLTRYSQSIDISNKNLNRAKEAASIYEQTARK